MKKKYFIYIIIYEENDHEIRVHLSRRVSSQCNEIQALLIYFLLKI